MQETPVQFLGGEDPLEKGWATHSSDGSDSKESACNAGNLGSIPGLGRSSWGRHGNPLQYSCLEHPHGQRRLGGYSPWGHKESDTTERLSTVQRLDVGLKRSLWSNWDKIQFLLRGPYASHLFTLCLSLLICKMRALIVLTSQECMCVKVLIKFKMWIIMTQDHTWLVWQSA